MVISAVVLITILVIGFEYVIATNASLNQNINSTSFWLMRIAALAPSIYFLWFAMSQYKRERTLVQEYSHRFAVATSIPSYRDQLKDEKAKDDISVAASHVIFDVPVANEKEVSIEKSIKRISELIGAIKK